MFDIFENASKPEKGLVDSENGAHFDAKLEFFLKHGENGDCHR